jgi:superfamily II DNA or RNA helicase
MELYFDRGTLVVEDAGLLADLPPYFRWDQRVGRWRAPAHRLGELRRWLEARRLAVTYRSARPDGFVPVPVPGEGQPFLRPYQEEALAAWAASGRRGLVGLPTGSGKTRLAIRAMLALGRSTLVVAPTRQLVQQWAAAIREFYSGPVGIFGDGERELAPITAATYESAHLHLDRLGDHFDLLVVDEAHHFTSARLQEIAQMSTAPLRLGLSGTFPPAFLRDRAVGQLLGPVCFALPLARLAGAYLSTFELKVIPLRLTAEEQATYETHRRAFLMHYRSFAGLYPEAAWSDFARAACASPGGRGALAAFRRARDLLSLPRAKLQALDQLLDAHRDDRTLVFTADNRAAYEVSRRFLIPAITCEIERRERESVLARFRDGVYRALVSAKVLNEGIDVPAASVAIICGGSSNPVEHAQRIGRVLRPKEGKKAVVYELVIAGTSEWRTSERRSRSGAPGGAPAL